MASTKLKQLVSAQVFYCCLFSFFGHREGFFKALNYIFSKISSGSNVLQFTLWIRSQRYFNKLFKLDSASAWYTVFINTVFPTKTALCFLAVGFHQPVKSLIRNYCWRYELIIKQICCTHVNFLFFAQNWIHCPQHSLRLPVHTECPIWAILMSTWMAVVSVSTLRCSVEQHKWFLISITFENITHPQMPVSYSDLTIQQCRVTVETYTSTLVWY